MLAAGSPGDFLMSHVVDHPWPGCQVTIFGMEITWMSSSIASMIIVGLALCIILPLRAKRAAATGKGGILEVTVLFVRNNIAIPALGENANRFLPMLLTMFVFVLGMNLIGLLPIQPLCHAIPGNEYMVGATPTSVLTVCGALGGITLVTILTMGVWRAAQRKRESSNWPMALCIAACPVLWVMSLAPNVPGTVGKVLALPLAALEFIGAIAKCFALMVRIFANMLAGHFLLAVMMMFIVRTLVSTIISVMDPAMENEIHFFYIGPVCIVASVLVDLMELLVAGLQAYIYTFLSAMFFGLYIEASH
ncbi:MAG: F0F1 ATP synthase subunit A [Phycisphaerae bacterium]|nr:F0F1 ATP synthase subunit A [Phycisphaerae bacterium]